jgi:hypothetical protein
MVLTPSQVLTGLYQPVNGRAEKQVSILPNMLA